MSEKGDFVLRLAEGVTDPEGTVKAVRGHAAVGEMLRPGSNSQKALSRDRAAKAAYLHGSFGSGKSHFMAILYLLLQGDSYARSIPELANVISSHNTWTKGKKFLLVPYHLIAAKNLESAILGGYAEYIHRHFQNAPTPAVYRSEGTAGQCGATQGTMGDEKFFRKLNEAAKGNSGDGAGWGNISATWTPNPTTRRWRHCPAPRNAAAWCGTLWKPFPGDAQN